MKFILPITCFLSIIILQSTLYSQVVKGNTVEGLKVRRVIDGDTIELSTGVKVRYIGVDTPETKHPSKQVERFGIKASEANKSLVEGKNIKIEFDTQKQDKYGRVLAYVYVDTIFVNAWLVKNGLAKVSTYPPNVRYQELFTKLQQEARNAKRGLWAPLSSKIALEPKAEKKTATLKASKDGYLLTKPLYGKVLREVKKGTEVQIISYAKDDFFKVKIDSEIGFMCDIFLPQSEALRNAKKKTESSYRKKKLVRKDGVHQGGHFTAADKRTWTQTGGNKIEAEYVSCHNGIVRMKGESGKTQRVPMWTLSQKDQMFVVKTKGWAVVKAHRQANVKASLDVRLAERISKQKLTEIANELHGFADNKQPRLFIVYYLPDMKIDTGGWATSHFNPKLAVKVLGASKEEHQRLLAKTKSTTPSEEIIGSWSVNKPIKSTITFLRKKSGKTLMRQIYKDGSGGEHELIIQKVGSQIRYRQKGGHPADYFIITSSGDLGHCDDEGMWATSKRMTSR